MQARLALEHGKRVFLVADLVTKQPWARAYLSRPGAAEIQGAEDVACDGWNCPLKAPIVKLHGQGVEKVGSDSNRGVLARNLAG